MAPPRTRRRVRASAVALLLLLLAAACGGTGAASPDASGPRTGGDAPHTSGRGPTPAAPSGELVVFAAASLTDAFTAIGAAFTDEHPQVSVVFNFAGSQRLATQILAGAPADVFASADETQMAAVRGRIAGRPQVFARNRLAIAVEAGNPRDIGGVADLARDDVSVVLAAEEVPAGRYARQALRRAGIAVSPVSLEANVRAVLTKVLLGEADAGIVYRSDLVDAGDDVEAAAVTDGADVVATYPIAVVEGTATPRAAAAFVGFVRSDEGRAVLARHGFSLP